MEPEELWATSRQTSLRMLAYDQAEARACVVVLHGMVESTDVLRHATAALDPYASLSEHRFNVLALDWPGHGRSGGRRGHLTYRLAMDAAATAVEVAAERWHQPVGLFGTSLGGVLAFYAALEDELVRAVACHNVLDLRDVRPVIQRWRQGALLPTAGLARRWLPERLQKHVPIPAAAVFALRDLAADPDVVAALRRHPQSVLRYDLYGLGTIFLTPEDKPDIAAQTTPTFVAVGGADRILPETPTRAFAARVPAVQRLWVLPGASHELLLEHPDALLPAVAQFLHAHLDDEVDGGTG